MVLALENAKAVRLEITKNDKIEENEKERQKELDGVSGDDEKKKINDKYDELKKSVETEYDAKIKSAKDKSKEIEQKQQNNQKQEAKNKKEDELIFIF